MVRDPESERRAFFAARFPEFWASFDGVPYALLEAHPVSAETIRLLHDAARDAWRIFLRVVPVLAALPDDALADMGIPRHARRIVRRVEPALGPSVFARFDFALTPTGPRVLEVNAETPFFLWESHAIAGAVATHVKMRDPNDGSEERLRRGFERALRGLPRAARIAVTALNPYREDWFTARYLADLVGRASGGAIDVVPTNELRIAGGSLRDAAGNAIDVLWRMYPLEHFANDAGGASFCRLVEDGRLTIVNPAPSLLLQSKAAQAVIWGLHVSGSWFTADEHAIVERIFLPSSLDPPSDGRYVRKPVLGREGNTVAIVDSGTTVVAARGQAYAAQPMLYQRFVELPRVAYTDPRNPGSRQVGYGVYTAFVVGGEVTAIGLRIGDRITDVRALFMPLGMHA